jgi:hypothetical protein
MHPNIHEDHRGDCPICDMKPIAVSKSAMKATTQIYLSPENKSGWVIFVQILLEMVVLATKRIWMTVMMVII